MMSAGLLTTPVTNGKKALRSLLPRAYLNWRDARFYARYGEIELHLLEFLCDPKREALDIGANEGCYTNLMRRLSSKVIAFEPLPWLARGLVSRFGNTIDVREVALSNVHATAILRVPVVNGIDVEGCATIDQHAATHYAHHREIEVETRKLDDIYAGDPGFIKIDTEGHEEAVLEGARKTIARSRPCLLVEIVDYLAPGGAARIANYFRQLGYVGYFIYRRQILSIEAFDPAVMQAKENEPDLTAPLAKRERFPLFAYNFLFFPRERSEESRSRVEACIARL